MRRYETIVKIETIRALLQEGEYAQAQRLADEIDSTKLKKRGDVHVLAEAYKLNEQYETAQELLLRLYEEHASRRLIEELLELSLLQKDVETAEMYFGKYQRISGGDPANYIYEYRIGRLKGKEYEDLLPVLQTLKEEQYTEKYAYELAKVYHKLGRGEECMAECSDLILWFGEGRYVEKAKALQAYYTGELALDELQGYRARQKSVTESVMEYGSFASYEVTEQEESKQTIAEEQSSEQFYTAQEFYMTTNKQNVKGEVSKQQDWKNVILEKEEASSAIAAYQKLMQEAAGLVEDSEDKKTSTYEMPSYTAEMPQESTGYEPDNTVYDMLEETMKYGKEPISEQQMSAYERLMREAANMEENEAEVFETVLEQPTSQAEQDLLRYLEECGVALEDTLHTFAYIPSVRSQLLQGMDALVSGNSSCYCMVVTGDRKSGKTTFAKDVVKLLYQLSWLKKPKVAVITGTKMNEIVLEEKKAQLQGCCLIIEKAGRMSEETMLRLGDFIQNGQTLGMVILEDREKRINCLMRSNNMWSQLFSVRIQLPKYTEEDLFGFAIDYIKEQDYSIEENAKAALYEKIVEMVQIEAGEGRLVKTLQFAKDALEKAEERNQAAIFNMVENGSFSANDVLTLKREDVL